MISQAAGVGFYSFFFLSFFKESTDLKEAFKILTTFDSKLENQMKYAGPPQQVYAI
jgi:hypothetical protein